MDKKYLTTYEIALICGVSPVTVGRWIDSNKLEGYKTVGGHRRVDMDVFLKFVDKYEIHVKKEMLLGRNRICIVDDDQMIINIIKRIIGQMRGKYVIKSAMDGFEAGLLVSEFRPQLIFLDLMMPGLDGFEVCSRIKKNPNLKNATVIAVSGFLNEEYTQRIIQCGASQALRKPFNHQDIKDIVRQTFHSKKEKRG